MGRWRARAPRWGLIGVAAAMVVISACSGSGADPGDGSGDQPDPSSDPVATSTPAPDQQGGQASPDGDSDSDDPAVAATTAPLGFDSASFDVPIPAEPASELGAFEDANDLIDAGIDAGLWSEVDGVRAVISVMMGERPPESIPALQALPRFHYREVVERAIGLVEDPAVDPESAADLARLITFFTAERLESTPDGTAGGETGGGEDASGATQGVALVGLRPSPQQAPSCGAPALQLYRPQEDTLFGAEPAPASVCYQMFEQDGDVVYIAALEDAVDISDLIFDVISTARPGFLALAGQELQPVEVLVSINPSPPDEDSARGDALAHVGSAGTSVCRVAIFASDTLSAGTDHLEFTIAHELFHCIQKLWSGARPHKFVEEAGPDYFAYEVLGKLCTGPQVALGSSLDATTATGSLLTTTYDGWFFWAFLAEHGHANPQQVAAIHEAVYGGAAIDSTVIDALADPPKVLNEFFVRLVGPGLACGFRGDSFTSPVTIDQKGPVDLTVDEIWHGTRYQLNYAVKKLYEQREDGGGPIGMAEFDKRADAGEWVTTEPEVRTTCTDEEKWMVVVSPASVGASSLPRKLEVDAAKPGGCDPCVLGSWSIDLDSFEAFMETLSQGQDIEISGSYMMDFAEGPPDGGLEYSDRRNIAISFPGTGTPLAVRLDGAGSGTYTATDGHLQSQGYSDSGVASAVGLPIEASTPFANAGDGGAPYTCEDDLLTINVNGSSLVANRIPDTPQGPPYFG